MTRLGLENFWSIPRVSSLRLSPDGRRLVLAVQSLTPDSKKFVTALWEIPADGAAPPRRLTYSERGEGPYEFLPDGSILFGSARPNPTTKDDEADGRLFRLAAGGGEAEPVLSLPAGVEGLATAAKASVAVVKTSMFPSAPGLAEDGAKAKLRTESGVSAVLFEDFPIRFWDHDLGPRQARLFRVDLDESRPPEPAEVAVDVSMGLAEAAFDVSADGSAVVATIWRNAGGVEIVTDLVHFARGERRVLATAAGWAPPAISPDGRHVVTVRESFGAPDRVFELTLCVFDLETGEARDLATELDLVPLEPSWAADGRSVWFTADERGRCPLFNVPIDGGPARKVAGRASYLQLQPSPDGAYVYALRSGIDSPPLAVRIDASTGQEAELPTPGRPVELPGRLEEVSAARDGAELRGWLVLPEEASSDRPAPLLLWIHGGPFLSWNAWSWRWCPYLMAELGYAVLMPDPALSTGYGREHIARGWGRWGEPTWSDLELVLDAALRRPDLDGSRTAAMGASFGGYMANWVATHTDRFRCIVSHAGTWDELQFTGTTDQPHWGDHEFGDPERDRAHYEAISPRTYADQVRTPVLLTHGALDYRVPVSESLRMYAELRRRNAPVKFLYFPDENHWILKPGNSRVWYQTLAAFLAEHVLGSPRESPELI